MWKNTEPVSGLSWDYWKFQEIALQDVNGLTTLQQIWFVSWAKMQLTSVIDFSTWSVACLIRLSRSDCANRPEGAAWLRPGGSSVRLHSVLWEPEGDGRLPLLEVRLLGESPCWAPIPHQVHPWKKRPLLSFLINGCYLDTHYIRRSPSAVPCMWSTWRSSGK